MCEREREREGERETERNGEGEGEGGREKQGGMLGTLHFMRAWNARCNGCHMTWNATT